MQRHLLLKSLIVGALCLLALIPLAMVRGLIAERSRVRDEVVRSIAHETVGAQAIKGPVLVIPYRRRIVDTSIEKRSGDAIEVKRERFVTGSVWLLPEQLEAEGQARPGERRRGIYTARTYTGDWILTGRFAIPPRYGTAAGQEGYTWGRPVLALGISDPRGLAPGLTLSWDSVPAEVEAGTGVPGLGRGVHAAVQARPAEGNPRSIPFALRLTLTGLERLEFLPTGRVSTVKLESSWPHPGFFGPRLADHQIDAGGFRAVWRTSFLSSNLPGEYGDCFERGRCEGFDRLAFGVSFVQPVNVYQRLERSAKYGLLFVGLTFLCFFFFDVLKQQPIHPIQYGLVGGALVVFYLLLASLAEQIAFGYAYAIAATACAALIGYYVSHVLGSLRRGALVAGVLAALYAVLYAILRSEDNALLMGSLLLFALAAAIMIGTRKVDWYSLGRSAGNPGPA